MSRFPPGIPGRRVPMTLGALALIAPLSAGVAASPELPPVVRALSGVLVLLPLTGYSLTRALFRPLELHPAERVALALGLAASTAILGGFILHVSPLGLTAGSWAALLAGETLLALLIAALREAGTAREAVTQRQAPLPGTLATSRAPGGRRGLLDPSQLALLATAAVLTVSAVLLARVGAAEQPYPGFTQLWLLPGEDGTVTLGVRNEEGQRAAYELELIVDGRVQERPVRIDLPDGGQVERVERIISTAATVPVEARLFRLPRDGDGPYRQVSQTLVQPRDPTSSEP